MPCRPYIALRTSLAVMEGHFFTSGTRAFTRDRTLGLSDFILASPKGQKDERFEKEKRKKGMKTKRREERIRG